LAVRKKVCQKKVKKKKKKKGWSEVIEIEKTEKCREKERGTLQSDLLNQSFFNSFISSPLQFHK
jgi:hypothetical protein